MKMIFIVDDQPGIAFLIEELLKIGNPDFLFQYINSGIKTLEALKSVTPDLILLDVRMPEMDGIEVCRIIKEDPAWKFIPIIMLTGLSTKEDLAQCLAAGADDFVTKPFNDVELKARVQSMLRIKQQYDQLKDLQALQEKLLRLLEGELNTEKENREKILDSLNEAVIVTDQNGIISYANNFNVNLFEKERNEVIGNHFDSIAKFIVNDRELTSPFNYLTNSPASTLKVVNANNRERIIEFNVYLSNSKTDFILVFKDITTKYEMDKLINYQISHDSLTGLLNRNEFELSLHKSLINALAANNEYALLYLDLDQFKIVNDSCGHFAGDELLRQVAGILKNIVEKPHSLFRIGGDEFTIILEDADNKEALFYSAKIIDELNKAPFSWKDNKYTIGTSIGIVSINKETVVSSPDQILTYADNACFVAKHNGRNRSHIFSFDDTFLSKKREEIVWLNKIKSALENNKFRLFFQEIKALEENHGERSGEVLIRMTEGGKIISPYLFIPSAEHFNKMVEIDKWVVENTFAFISKNAEKVENILFKINLSGQSLGNESFVYNVLDCFAKYNIEYKRICFEITETVAISNLSSAINFINFFRNKGCLFSLDDFGTGLSSFGYLKNLPVNFVKIDGSFVREINNDNYCLNMIEAINNISHSMNLKTIAEFVESESIYDKLKEIKIDFVQGYYISQPSPLEDLLL
jgi:diguanylate cyclase (GGDEF)-like protein